jgi:hypothetical protein
MWMIKFQSPDDRISYRAKKNHAVRKTFEKSCSNLVKFDTVRKTDEFLSQNEYRTKTYEDRLEIHTR